MKRNNYLLTKIYYLMKLNKILMALAATAIVGCTSDDLNDFSAKQAPEDSRMIELSPNFVLAGVGEEGAMTRTHWDQDPETKALVNMFLPFYTTAPDGSKKLNKLVEGEDYENVGLCWLGQTPGTDANVYTNYQFYHFGWLKKGETEADVDNCGEFGNLYNGALYSDITPGTGAAIGDEANPVTDAFALSNTPVDRTGWELNYNSGVYRTDNKAIFGGKYIVYYPFNKDFQETGTIPAKAVTSFEWTPGTPKGYTLPALGKATFRYSAPVDIEGGNQAANFAMYNLSTLVRLRVSAPVGDTYIGNDIDKIVLLSESGKLLKQANLAADKIYAGKKGAELYAETEGTKTISTNFTAATSLDVKAATTVSAYITVLPTTVPDLVALVHNKTKNMWARVDLGNTVFEAGTATVFDISVAAANFKSEFIAVDQASLAQALADASLVASESDPQTINVIGDIKLESNLNIDNTYANGRYITIDGGDIIVPQNVTLTLDYLKEMKSTVRVLGKDCCTPAPATGGRLVVNGTSTDPKDVITLNNVTLEKTEARVSNDTEFENFNPMVTYQGKTNITIADDKKVNVIGGTVKVDRAVEHKGDIEIAKDGKVNVSKTGNLSFLGSTVDNYGTIEVAKEGQFYMKNANGSSVWTDGQTMTNHETGKFIHNVDAVVGTAVQYMNQNGEYRCRVDKQKALDDAYTQWIACNVIEMVNKGAEHYNLGKACKHKHKGVDKYIDIEVNNPYNETTFDDWDVETGTNKPSDGKNIEIGNLTVVKSSRPLTINYKDKGDAAHTQRQLTVHGNMTVSENTSLTESKKVTVTGNLAIDNKAKLTYAGEKKIVDGLKVDGDITVTDATFNASANDAIKIECTNFSLIKKDAAGTGASAEFGNRKSGNTDKSMTVNGTISNGKGCTFTIKPAASGNLLAWITCYKVEGEGTFAGTPTVIKP
jgi:hypothetical protein